jgi:hypothetical protein
LELYAQGYKAKGAADAGAAAEPESRPLSTPGSSASRKAQSPLSLADGFLGSMTGNAAVPQMFSSTPISTNSLLRSFSWPEPTSPSSAALGQGGGGSGAPGSSPAATTPGAGGPDEAGKA